MGQRSLGAARSGAVIDDPDDIGARRRIAQVVRVADKAMHAEHVDERDILYDTENRLLSLAKIGGSDLSEAGSAH